MALSLLVVFALATGACDGQKTPSTPQTQPQAATEIEAKITQTSASVKLGEMAKFSAKDSIAKAGIKSYKWQLKQGSNVLETGAQENFDYTFTKHGSFTLELTIEDNKTKTHKTSKSIEIAEPDKTIVIITADKDLKNLKTAKAFGYASFSVESSILKATVKKVDWLIVDSNNKEIEKKTYTGSDLNSYDARVLFPLHINKVGEYTVQATITDVNDEAASAQLEFELKDGVEPILQKQAMQEGFVIKTGDKLDLTFSEALVANKINSTNIFLHNVTDESDKVSLNINSTAASAGKIGISISGTVDLNKNYLLVVQNMQDSAGNKTPTIKINYLGSKFENLSKKVFLTGDSIELKFSQTPANISTSQIEILEQPASASVTSVTNNKLTFDKKLALGKYLLNLQVKNAKGEELVKKAFAFEVISLENADINKIVYVKPTATDASPDGTNWSKAYGVNGLQDAINSAANGATSNKPGIVFMQNGTYDFSSATTSLKSNVHIYGGIAAKTAATQAFTERDLLNKPSISKKSTYMRIFDIRGTQSSQLENVKIDGFTFSNLTNTQVSDRSTNLININYAKVELNNLTFSNNKKLSPIFLTDDFDVKIANANFLENKGAYNGGGVYIWEGAKTSKLTISDSLFSENSVTGDGGAIYLKKGLVSIARSVFYANTANEGPVLYTNADAKANIDSSAFIANVSSRYSGVIQIAKNSELNIINSTFSANKARSSIALLNSNLLVSNSTFADNRTTAIILLNGGHKNQQPSLIYNSIFWNNKIQAGDAAARDMVFYNNVSLTLKNSIVSKTYTAGQNGIKAVANLTVLDATSASTAAPLGKFDPAKYYYPLATTSPALNAGDNSLYLEVYNSVNNTSAAAIPAQETDQIGNKRLNGTIDMGAVESQ